MANEFKHKSVGTSLTQEEFEGTSSHGFDGQQSGDLLYASSSEQLSRLPAGSTGQTLVIAGGVPAWTSPHGSWTTITLSQDFTTTSASNTNVTDFYFTPGANKTYLVQGMFLLRTATTTVGARPGIAWPTGLTDGTARVEASSSLTASTIRSWGAKTGANSASTGLATTADSHFGNIEALLIAGAGVSGNFQITLASETAGTTVTMKAGSFFMYREL